MGVGIDGIVWTTSPERVFVELKSLVDNAAEDHRSETAITDPEVP